jgi:hypothetical protein
MLLRCLLAAAFVAAAPVAHAQVFYVVFKDPKTAKRFPHACIEKDGQQVLVGEAKSGISLEGGVIRYQGDKGMNELWAVNTADPSAVPYKLAGDSKENAGLKGGVAAITGSQIEKIQILLGRHSLYGLAREHAIRRETLAAAQKSRDANKPGTAPWSLAHARMLGEMERLHTWLDTTAYPEAAKKLEAELEKQRKTVAKEAYAKRLATALASIQIAPTPDKLVELGKTIAPDAVFKVQESTHLRITYEDDLGDETVKALLELGETMIDGFRAEYVDPYLGEDFADHIPDARFMELWFGPTEKEQHARFLPEWYGVQWGNNREERIAAMSGRYHKADPPEYLDYWKIADNKDFDAILAHELGHVLANLHFNAGRKGDLPAWIEEGVGYWLALAYLGKNGVTCKEFKRNEYGTAGSKVQIERAILMGETELFTTVALESGPPADALLRKPLHQMEDADLAKSFSFFEWVARKEGKPGQLWLRALCEVFSQSGPSLAQFREKSEQAFGISGQDVFKVLDERWKAHATELLKTGLEPRKK